MQRNSFNSEKSNGVNIKVIVRCRPLNEKEKNDANNVEVVKINNNEVIVTLNKNNETYEKKYSFDYACDEYVDQRTLFNDYIFQIVDEVLEGFNCTLFCYGQTGTGKTYTMEGKMMDAIKSIDNKKTDLSDSINSDTSCYHEMCDNEDAGIIFRVIKRIFEFLNKKKEESFEKLGENVGIKKEANVLVGSRRSNENVNNMNEIECADKVSICDYNIKVSYLEIYNEELCDLLSSTNEVNKLRIYEDVVNKNKGLSVDKLEEKSVNSFEDIYYIICSAVKRRKTANTLYNKQSSRSHSIFTVTLTMKYLNMEGESLTKIGKLNLVDLAGSENAIKSNTGNLKVRQQESCNINQSLLTLGRVINALVENSSYIPYRDSKLTRLLQDSLGGKTKTFIVATISPSSLCIDETLGTLDYVYRAKNVKNKPEINVKATKQVKIRDLNNEIEKLKNALNLSREKRGVYLDNEEYNNIQNSLKQNQEIITEKNKVLLEKTMEINNLLAVMDYTDDAKKKILQLAKNIMEKYKTIQNVHEILIHKMAEEKCVSSFIMDEFQNMEDKYYNIIKLYKEYPQKIANIYNENFMNIKKNMQKEKIALNKTCDTIMQVLVETKNDINENKQSLAKSIKCFQKLINHLCSKKRDLLNFVLDHLDIVQKFDQNYVFIIEKIKKYILQCKLNDFSKHQVLNSLESQETSQIQASQLEVLQEDQKKRKELSEKVSNLFKEIAGHNDEIEELNKINVCLTQEKTNTQSLIHIIQMVCTMFQSYLLTFTTTFKKKVEEKNCLLNKEFQNFCKIFENLNNDYNSFEEKINKTNSEIINKFKMEIKEEIKLFQEQLLDEIKNVVTINVNNVNEKINVKFDKFNSNLHSETKKQYKHFYTSSLKMVETFLNEFSTKTKKYQMHFIEAHEKFYETIQKYYCILNYILADIHKTIAQEVEHADNNVTKIIDIYNETVKKNNNTIEEIAKQFQQQTNNHMIEKEQLYQIISNKILQEKNAMTGEEEKANTHMEKSNECVKTCTSMMLENVDRFDLHLNELMSFLKKDFFENTENEDNIIKTEMHEIDEIKNREQVEKVKNIQNSIEKLRNYVNRQFYTLKKENRSADNKIKKEIVEHTVQSVNIGCIDKIETSESDQGTCEKTTPMQIHTDDHNSNQTTNPDLKVNGKAIIIDKEKDKGENIDTDQNELRYTEIKNNILQEVRELSNQKNEEYKELFDNLYGNISDAQYVDESEEVMELLKMLSGINETRPNKTKMSISEIGSDEGSNYNNSSNNTPQKNVNYKATRIQKNNNACLRNNNNNATINKNERSDQEIKEITKLSKNYMHIANIREDENTNLENLRNNKKELNHMEVNVVNTNTKNVKNRLVIGNSESSWNRNYVNMNGNISPSNTVRSFENQSKKASPIMKRLNNDIAKDRKGKLPRKSIN